MEVLGTRHVPSPHLSGVEDVGELQDILGRHHLDSSTIITE